MICVDGHTIDETLLTGQAVIDIGCRGFVFSNELEDMGCITYPIDADKLDGEYFHVAITPKEGKTTLYQLTESSYTKDIKEFTPEEGIEVDCMPLNIFYDAYVNKLLSIDILKLDIEGGEYSILTNPEFRPLPKQITVEFHEHVFPELHKEMYPKVLANLSKWYDLVYQRPDEPLMDCLFIRR